MKKNGVITIFLSLILLLFLNFLMTTIEAARITAGKSYAEILGQNAVTALEARYYYPLFSQYGILAVDGGMEGTMLDTDSVNELLVASLDFAKDRTAGGLISFDSLDIDSMSLATLVTDSFAAFSDQVCAEAKYDGAELLCDFLSGDSLETVTEVSKLTESQQEAADSVTQVSIEILKLMQLVDGVCTDTTGLKTAEDGSYQVADSFTKKLCAGDAAALRESYGEATIYETVKEDILYGSDVLANLSTLATDYNNPDNFVRKDSIRNLIVKIYGAIGESIISDYEMAIKQAAVLAWTQELAQPAVLSYGQEILESALDDSVLSGLLDDLETLEAYVGLTESDYDGAAIKETLETNLTLLENNALPDIDGFFYMITTEEGSRELIDSEALVMAVSTYFDAIDTLSYTNLKFDYGDLQTSDTTEDLLKSGLSALFSEGVFSLLGISDVSDREIDGADLPSKGKATETGSNILGLFKEMQDMVASGNLGALLKGGYEELSEDFLTEVYLQDHFSDFTADFTGKTKLAYEREYILHGQKKDSDNLINTAMQLIALRAVFCFTALMTNATRYQEAGALAQTMAVFGIPALITAAKYLILTVWAIEEAIIEVSALFAGKKVPVFDPDGNLEIYELLTLTPEVVKAKAEAISSSASGIGYSSYIVLLSFLQTDHTKKGRTLDLIQENIRYRYRDTFRIGNCITGGNVSIDGTIERRFSAGFFSEKAYRISFDTAFGY